jgi:hypothetical protein
LLHDDLVSLLFPIDLNIVCFVVGVDDVFFHARGDACRASQGIRLVVEREKSLRKKYRR